MKGQDEQRLRLSAEVSPASRSVSPDDERDLMIPATCGRKCAGLFRNSGPIGCLAKMLLGSSIWGSTKRYLIWKKSDTLFKHSYFRLAVSAHGMNAQELLSSRLMFPTPLASDKSTARNAMNLNVFLSDNGIFRKINPNGAIWSLPLSAAVFYLTPIASDGLRSDFPPEIMLKSKNGANLAAQIIKQEKPTSEKAAINPDWVEWLMGFPRKWTDVNCGNESLKAFRV